MNKISGIYKITNTVTKDFYIGSSKNVKQRWANHKCHSTWKNHPNNPMYLDMRKYGVDKFELQILAEVETNKLKEMEQQFIEILNPTYNDKNAKGLNVERKKETNKEYQKSDKFKEHQKEYHKSDKYKEYQKSDKFKECKKESNNKYKNQLCCYNGETLTLNALYQRFQKAGISNSIQEARKYIIKK